jgi:hypothetical protein
VSYLFCVYVPDVNILVLSRACLFVRVRVCERSHECVCVCVCVFVCVCEWFERVCVSVSVRA